MKHWKPLLLCGAALLCTSSVRAFTPTDADTLFNAYNNAFYVGNGGSAYYKADNSSGSGRSEFWKTAEEIEAAEDAYGRTGSSGTRDLITALCNGFTANQGTLWTNNAYNDDIQWACIAFLRAYQITGNTSFRDTAKNNWDAMYTRGWDGQPNHDGPGGIWWNTSNQTKNACSNGPAAIGAYLIYKIYNDSSYLTKAQNIYNWEKFILFDGNTGAIYDNLNNSGGVDRGVYSYNLGTFIGTANLLGQTADAKKTADYTKNTFCNNGGLFPDVYGSAASANGGDGAGFHGIFIRWMAKYMSDRGLQSDYLAWLQLNADAAWNVRRTSDNLSWCNWDGATPSGTLYSYDCLNSVVALQVIPADGEGVTFYEGGAYGGRPGQLLGTGTYTLSQLQAKGVQNDWASSLRVPAGWQVTMYADDNFGGGTWTYTGDTWNLGNANDQMSSCKIQTTGVIFYQDGGYGGNRGQALAKGTYTGAQLAAKGVPNDWASSVRIPPGWTVIVYQNDNFTGTSWTFTGDSWTLGTAANDQMSSCKIQ